MPLEIIRYSSTYKNKKTWKKYIFAIDFHHDDETKTGGGGRERRIKKFVSNLERGKKQTVLVNN